MILSIGSSSWQPVRVESLARRGVLKHRLEQIGRLILQRMDRVLQGICIVARADGPRGAMVHGFTQNGIDAVVSFVFD